ncbi:MAG: hypothetical protein M3439_02015, partial [Chloroflexota bacterium]|nr:hypothetical protein [Chloroflexota bacterium]
MKPERHIRATYADIFDSVDPATMRVLGDLDALYTSGRIPTAPSFHALLATRARSASRASANDGPETASSSMVISGAAPPRSRHSWLRQGFAFTGAALAFALVAVVLVLLFRGDDESSAPGAQPEASPTTTVAFALPASPAADATLDQIAFTSIRDGNAEIYLANADGSGLTRLTDNPDADFEPAWSPDGARIAFVSVRDGQQHLYVMNADGSNVQRVTDDIHGVVVPVWSPDGVWIAFSGVTDTSFMDIFIVRPDGSDLRQLTDWQGIDTAPAWSLSSQQIAYQSDAGAGGMLDIFVVNIDGTGSVNLTNDVIQQREPHWSSDGAQIAFSHASHEVEIEPGYTGTYDTIAFYNTTLQGGNPFRPTSILGSTPRWSPDGHYLAYRRFISEPGRTGTTAETLHLLQADGLETGRIPGIE